MTKAVVELWTTVLGRPDIEPTDEFTSLCPDLGIAGDVTALVNQWFDTRLTVRELFRLGNSVRLAEHLRGEGVVVPLLPASPPGPPIDLTSADITEYRRSMWEATYRFSGQAGATTFNTSGWFDSTSCAPMPEAQLREWARNTVDRVSSLNPASVLDVGCGTGLILADLAPRCARYTGTDFSTEAIALVHDKVAADPALRHVEALATPAADVRHHVDGRYDVVLINSVVQYFPDAAYLRAVLSAAAAVTASGGHIFLGDIRHRDLRRAGHLGTVLAGLPSETRVRHGRTALRRLLDMDRELVFSPDELAVIVAALDLRCTLVTLVRRGSQPTVMNRFRFDCVLTFGEGPGLEAEREVDWATLATRGDDPKGILTALLARFGSNLVVRAIPDRRTIGAVSLLKSFDAAPPDSPISAIPIEAATATASSIDPEEIWTVGEAACHGVAVAPNPAPGYVDAAFSRDRDPWTAAILLGRDFSSAPVR